MSIHDFSTLLDQVPPSGIRRFFDLVQTADDVISLGVGEPDFVTPWHIREDAINALEKGYTSYTSNHGMPACRNAISAYLKKRFNASYHPDQILLTVGVSEGVDIVFRSILNPGDEVLVPEPSYVCYAPLITLAGGKAVPIYTSGNGFVPSAALIKASISKKTKAILLCSPSNPTGAVIDANALKEIGNLAKSHDFWVLSDEIYAEITYDQPYVSFASFKDFSERCILLSGFSKAFAMTGWRLGYLCGPDAVISRALKIHQYSALCAPIMSQYAAIEALKHGQREVKKMTTSYARRRNLVVKRFKEMGLDMHTPGGAFYCFPSIRATGLTSEDFAMRLLEAERVAVVPGHVFGMGGEGHIRACYATDTEDLEEALTRIKRFVQSVT